MLRRLVREPLVGFLLLGGVLFTVSSFVGGSAGVTDRKIVVTVADVERLSQQFVRTWNRPASAEELQSQIDNYIREEVLYRTALSLGLDKDDFIVRRRLRQKMEFLVEGAMLEPQESELRAYFHAHESSFLSEPMVSFRQVLVSDSRGSAAERDAQVLLTKLIAAKSNDPEAGDPSLLPEDLQGAPLSRVRDQFGADFAESLAGAKPGQWTGPLRSAYGYHLVFVIEFDPSHLPRFEDVRAEVQRQWFAGNRTAVLDAQYRKLLGGFEVQIDHPAPSGRQP
jgi:parvulin-like peptidyl-prolyl isomerase